MSGAGRTKGGSDGCALEGAAVDGGRDRDGARRGDARAGGTPHERHGGGGRGRRHASVHARVDTTEAGADGPRFCSNNASVFYRFTASTNVRVQVDTLGSGYDTVLGIYTRDASGSVRSIGCSDDRLGYAAGLRLRAQASTTYYFIVGQCCGDGRRGGGQAVLTVTEVVDAALEATNEVGLPVAIDSDTGLVTVTGTITCNKRSVVYVDGMVRQVREGLFVARGWYWEEIPCTPGTPTSWSVEVDTETMVAFAAGPALLRTWDDASDGWSWVSLEQSDAAVELVSA